MRKCVIIVLLLALLPAFQARAQYVPQRIEQEKGRLLDDKGEVMPDFMVQRLVGDQIYEDTYLGARKQYKTGKRLIVPGLIGMGVGVAATGVATVKFFSNYIEMWGPPTEDSWAHLGEATDSVSWIYRGIGIVGVGYAMFTAGLIFKTIGWKRLEWVADEYNEGQKAPSVRIGQGQYGAGLVINF